LVFTGYLCISSLALSSSLSPLDNAIAVLNTGQAKQAIVLFEKQKHDPKAMVYLAEIYMDTDLDEAEEWIKKAIDVQSNDAETYYVRGAIMGW